MNTTTILGTLAASVAAVAVIALRRD